jgi:alkane 1-monooxygenase
MSPIPRHAARTLMPLALLMLGATAGGGLAAAALLWVILAGLLAGPAPAPEAGRGGARLPLLVAAGHFAALPLVLMALAGSGPGVALGPGAKMALFLGTAAVIAQVSLPAAHDLIHRAPWWQRWVGATVLTSLGFGHHVSAHRLVHHRHLGTYGDPHTPLPGEGFWTYLPRAWAEGFAAGRAAEEDRLARHGLGPRNWRNPYWLWLGGELAVLVGAVLIAGPVGVLACLALWLLAGTTVLMDDYLRHYGIRRLEMPAGGHEPVGAHHAWAAPRAAKGDAPRLPLPPAAMAVLAALPPLWRRVMDPRAARVMEAAAARIAAGAAPGTGMDREAVPTRHARAGTDTAPRPGGEARPGETTGATPEQTADAEMAQAMHEAQAFDAEAAADGALIARVRGLMDSTPPDPEAEAGPVHGPAPIEASRATARLKLSRPIRSARRAALRDR